MFASRPGCGQYEFFRLDAPLHSIYFQTQEALTDMGILILAPAVLLALCCCIAGIVYIASKFWK